MNKFHWSDGWYFERLDDGAVRVTKECLCLACRRPGAEHFIEKEAVIDARSWASIVASVSLNSETSGSYHAAEQLHGGHFDDGVITATSIARAGA